MNLVDALTTIAPITDVIMLDNKGSKNELEFVCTSGYHMRSNLNFIKEGIPYD